jgi:peptidoglycan/xylan/chitin deacetylase (PgdA/CDA1 family)/Tfp pilus assembly protein PilF
VCIAILAVLPSFGSDPYIDNLTSATISMQQGKYDNAVAEINKALTQRSNDPLAYITLGVMFLGTGQPDQAFKQFTTANNLSKDHPLVLYGFALYYLSFGKTDSALTYFRRAGANGVYDTTPAIAYISALSGQYQEEQTVNPVLQQIASQVYFKRGEYKKAREILQSMTSEWHGFTEETCGVMTFDPAKPLSFTGRPLSKPYKTPSQAEPKLKAVGGTVTLRAGLTKAQDVAYVLFYVDDDLLGMVNHHPFECLWDTTRFANSPHTVKIEGHNSAGIAISSKSTRVHVSNAGPSTASTVNQEDVKKVESKLWDCLRLKPSRRLAYYTLAKCAKAEKDDQAALGAMERVMGIDPRFRDARSLIIQWYSPVPPYRQVWRADTKAKLVAITFDDGPNPSSGRILDILAQKKVKATFFVVGGMAELYPDMIRRMASEGHEIENHTYSHKNLHYLQDVDTERELFRTVAIVRDLTGKSVRYFRPPGGNQNGNLQRAAGDFGFSAIFWTVNCGKNEGTKPEYIIKQVNNQTVPGSIILMHNVEEVTLMALPKVIDNLRAKGYKLVTLSELFAAE